MKLDVAILSKPGGRKYNEDYTGAAELGAFGCFVLADGLGGHRGGDIASKLTVESIMKSFKESPGVSTDKLKSFLCEADLLLRNSGPDQLMGGLPKTTLVVLLTGKNHACWAHIGDSRLYLFRDGNLLLQTKDHSVPQYLADSGSIKASDIRFHEDRNRLTAAFDGENLNRISFSDDNFSLEASDCFLLCSDGFWEYVLEAEMEEDLKSAKTPALWLDLMEKRLSARVESGNDNYSALAFFNS